MVNCCIYFSAANLLQREKDEVGGVLANLTNWTNSEWLNFLFHCWLAAEGKDRGRRCIGRSKGTKIKMHAAASTAVTAEVLLIFSIRPNGWLLRCFCCELVAWGAWWSGDACQPFSLAKMEKTLHEMSPASALASADETTAILIRQMVNCCVLFFSTG